MGIICNIVFVFKAAARGADAAVCQDDGAEREEERERERGREREREKEGEREFIRRGWGVTVRVGDVRAPCARRSRCGHHVAGLE